MRSDDLYSVPEGLAAPIDDGACDHLRVSAGTIVHVFYPVFPSDADAEWVIAWLRDQGPSA